LEIRKTTSSLERFLSDKMPIVVTMGIFICNLARLKGTPLVNPSGSTTLKNTQQLGDKKNDKLT